MISARAEEFFSKNSDSSQQNYKLAEKLSVSLVSFCLVLELIFVYLRFILQLN